MSPLPGTKPSLQRRQQDRLADRQIYPRQTAAPKDDWRFTFSTLDSYSIQPPTQRQKKWRCLSTILHEYYALLCGRVGKVNGKHGLQRQNDIEVFFIRANIFSRVDSQVWTADSCVDVQRWHENILGYHQYRNVPTSAKSKCSEMVLLHNSSEPLKLFQKKLIGKLGTLQKCHINFSQKWEV